MSGFRLAPASIEQLHTLARLEAECFSAPHSALMLGCDLANPACVMLVALSEKDEIAGYGAFHYVLDEGYTDNIAVFPAFRRLGVGRLIMSGFDAQARRLGLSFISLEVRVSNEAAISLYTSCGYKNEGTRKGFYAHPPEDAYIMTKRYQFER